MVDSVTQEAIERAKQMFQVQEPDAQEGAERGNSKADRRLDLGEYLEHYGIAYRIKQNGDRTYYCLRHCVFNSEHTDNDAAFIQKLDGALGYHCFHNSCQGQGWKEARQAVSGDDELTRFMKGGRDGYDGWKTPVTGQKQRHPWLRDGCDGSSETIYLSNPPPAPVEILPQKYRAVVIKAAKAFSVPLEIAFAALISVVGACIGRTMGILIKKGFYQCANLYLAVVGVSGIGKSPCSGALQRPMLKVERDWSEEYKAKLAQYKESLEVYKQAKKENTVVLFEKPERPSWKQLMVDDATLESLTDALEANPRGILWNRDELSGLILDLDKYTNKDGGTKARLLSAYDCGPWKVNRVAANRQKFIPHACLSIFGTIQPKALPCIFSNFDAVIGFLPRFLFVRAIQTSPAFWTEETLAEKEVAALDELVSSLLSYDFSEDREPIMLGVEQEAKKLFVEWFNRQAVEPWINNQAHAYKEVLAKLKGQCLRLCLILHCVESVACRLPETRPVSGETMERAITLANWFKHHQIHVWQYLGGAGRIDESSPLDERVMQAIVDLEGEIANESLSTSRITKEVNRVIDKRFHVTPEAVGKVCRKLGLAGKRGGTQRGWAITAKNLEFFKSILKTVTPVTSVTHPYQSKVSVCDGSNPTVTPVTEQEDPWEQMLEEEVRI